MSGPARTSIAAALAGVLCAACASRGPASPEPPVAVVIPERTAFEGTPRGFTGQLSSVLDTVLAAPRDRIWSALPSVLAQLAVPVTTRDARTFVIGTESWRPVSVEGSRLSSFLQCGAGIAGPNADTYEVTMQLLVQLEDLGPEGTRVRMGLDAYARPRYSIGEPRQCLSQGTLERRVFTLITEWLERPEGVPPAGPLAATLRRVPAAGDVIRLECFTGSQPVLHEGALLGGEGGELLLQTGSGADSLRVPVASVIRLQVRERRSRAGTGMVLGALLGIGAGVAIGGSMHDPDALNHYGRDKYSVVGAVLGGLAGAVLGRVTGSRFERDVWTDPPRSWTTRFGSTGPPNPILGPATCPAT
ncbi:MAG TPA: hypothetical protein VFQ22_04645 [Longimicrobiales bacterium]|nr:hypothetical protein [Longimicrobiales bacterium]